MGSEDVYPNPVPWYRRTDVRVSILGVMLTVLLLWGPAAKLPGEKKYFFLLAAGWALIPPVWFLWEWHKFGNAGNADRLKYSQELARNIWLALGAVIALLVKLSFPSI